MIYLVTRVYCLTESLRLPCSSSARACLRCSSDAFSCISVVFLSYLSDLVRASSVLLILFAFVFLQDRSTQEVPLPVLSIPSFYTLADHNLPQMGKRGLKFQDATTEKGVIIPSGRSDRGGGKTRRVARSPAAMDAPAAGAVERTHRAATEASDAPTLSCSSATAGWQTERLDPGNVIPRHTG